MIEVFLQKELRAAKGKMLLDVQFKIEAESFVTLYGASGAGKTSILRMLAGLMLPEKGRIKVNDLMWLDLSNKINCRPQQRNIGFLFQDYALFPNMTVQENLTFALQKNQSPTIISELIDIIELGDLQNRKPATLSGGQQQRVALARALVQKPTVLMLDEPLSALDNEMRQKLQNYILEVHRTYQLTTILVSHDESEILKMSDVVIHLENGKIAQIGAPTDILQTAPFQLMGVVMSLQMIDNQVKIGLKISNQSIFIFMKEATIEGIKVGDRVSLNATILNSTIKKMP